MTKIYLAAAFDRQTEMRQYRQQLEGLGIAVTSSWLDQPKQENLMRRDVQRANEFAKDDLADIDRADFVVVFEDGEATRTHGRVVEFGYALAKRKPIWLVGEPENIFHLLATKRFVSWTAVLAHIDHWRSVFIAS